MLAVRIAFSDPEKQALRQQYFEAHRSYLRNSSLRILLSGPLTPGGSDGLGALIVAEVESLGDLADFSAADPFVHHGVYGQVQILQWNVTLSSLAGITP